MKRKVFLQGDIGSGKSTLIKEVLLPFLPQAGGFFVQRILVEQETVAFRLVPLEGVAGYRLSRTVTGLGGVDNLFLYGDSRGGRWQRNLDVFSRNGLACLEKSVADHKKLILLDELGGVELHCPSFMDRVAALLDGAVPVLGVIKSPRNLKILEKSLDGEGKIDAYSSFYSLIRRHPRVELIPFDPLNRTAIRERLNRFVGAACR